MHHIYHTDAFVLTSRPSGEDSKSVALYTRELGLVWARGQALRKLASKLRYTLQDFSRANVDLVRGKEIWRITTAVPVHSYAELRKDALRERVLARIVSVVLRLCSGEDTNEEVFAAIEDTYSLLGNPLTEDTARLVELFCVSRILIALGYLSRDTFLEPATTPPSVPMQLEDEQFRKRLIDEINRAFAASNL
jgi:DNA repair protein RecO